MVTGIEKDAHMKKYETEKRQSKTATFFYERKNPWQN